VRDQRDVGLLGHLAVGADGLAAELVHERLRAPGHGVRGHDRIAPPDGERARHVPGADESDLHDAGGYPSGGARRDQRGPAITTRLVAMTRVPAPHRKTGH
jgi:hypothetical protein